MTFTAVGATPTPSPEPSPCDEFEAITDDLRLCEATYDDGSIELVFESDRGYSVEITDMAQFTLGGHIDVHDRRLEQGVNRIEIPVETVNGQAGVTIASPQFLYAIPVKTRSEMIGPPWSAQDAQLAGLGGALGTAFMVVLLAFRRILGNAGDTEQLA